MKLQVLMFGWEFPPHNSGGLGTACRGLSRSLVDKNVSVKFVLPAPVETDENWLEIIFPSGSSIDLKHIRALLSPYMTADQYIKIKNQYPLLADGYAPDLMSEVHRYAAAAHDIAEDVPHDIIHTHEWLTYMAGIEAKKVSGKPLIMHVHSTEIDRSGGNVNPDVYELEGQALHKADHILAVSGYTKDILMKEYKLKSHKIDIVHNGVQQAGETGHHVITEDKIHKLKSLGYKIVLYVGRFSLHKGPDYFVRAASKVLQYEPKTLFVMAGSGEMNYSLIELSADLGISKNMLFAGFLRGTELAHMYASADLYVLPSVSEPFGIAPLEALTYKTPVLISRQSGVSEALKNALKVDFWDVSDMAHKIVSVLRYGSLRSELSSEGHREVQKFNWDAAADKCLEVYHSVNSHVT